MPVHIYMCVCLLTVAVHDGETQSKITKTPDIKQTCILVQETYLSLFSNDSPFM